MIYTIDNPKLVYYYSNPSERNFTGVVKDKWDTIAYYKNGEWHREDGPAIIYNNGTKEWRINGEIHRADGPAIEYFNGNKHWYIHNTCHREDGPAIEYSNGDKGWYYDDVYHGRNDDFTNESWIKKLKLEIFK